jgi:hypothetical protein
MQYQNKGAILGTFKPKFKKDHLFMFIFVWLGFSMIFTGYRGGGLPDYEKNLANFLGIPDIYMFFFVGIIIGLILVISYLRGKNTKTCIYENGIEGFQANGKGPYFLAWDDIDDSYSKSFGNNHNIGMIYIHSSKLDNPLCVDGSIDYYRFKQTINKVLDRDHTLIKTINNVDEEEKNPNE